MSVSEYKVGKFYKLRDEYVDAFVFTTDIRRLMHIEGNTKRGFIFSPTYVSNGLAYFNGVVIANDHERTMFDEMCVAGSSVSETETEPTPERTKEYKPFTVGATYKLRKKFINEFHHTQYTSEKYGATAFTFTVSKIEYGQACEEKGGLHYIVAVGRERHMFKRIDNK